MNGIIFNNIIILSIRNIIKTKVKLYTHCFLYPYFCLEGPEYVGELEDEEDVDACEEDEGFDVDG